MKKESRPWLVLTLALRRLPTASHSSSLTASRFSRSCARSCDRSNVDPFDDYTDSEVRAYPLSHYSYKYTAKFYGVLIHVRNVCLHVVGSVVALVLEAVCGTRPSPPFRAPPGPSTLCPPRPPCLDVVCVFVLFFQRSHSSTAIALYFVGASRSTSVAAAMPVAFSPTSFRMKSTSVCLCCPWFVPATTGICSTRVDPVAHSFFVYPLIPTHIEVN